VSLPKRIRLDLQERRQEKLRRDLDGTGTTNSIFTCRTSHDTKGIDYVGAGLSERGAKKRKVYLPKGSAGTPLKGE